MRPAYTLGGTGGGVAYTPEEMMEIGLRGLKLSLKSQVMIERCLLGWKEVEYEVMRDANDTCIQICSMENFDPMGVHTGDSIVVAPMQTLTDKEFQMLRTASLKIIRALKIEGGCNVQLAMSPDSFEYYVIEVNPRVSRSSALAPSDGLPDCAGGVEDRGGAQSGRDIKCRHRQDQGCVRADHRLYRRENPAVAVR